MSWHTGFTAGTINLNNHRRLPVQRGDLAEAIDEVLLAGFPRRMVIAVQEAAGALDVPGFETVQAKRHDGSWAGEALLVSDELKLGRHWSKLAIDGTLSTREDPIRDRFHPAAWVLTPLGWVKVVANHDAPRDYDQFIRSRSRRQLARMTRGRRRWLALGDFNDRPPQAAFGPGEHIAGDRIDLIFGSRRMATHAVDTHVVPFPARNDDHPAVFTAFTTKETR